MPGKGPVQRQVGRRVGGRAQLALDDLPVQIHDDHVRGPQLLVGDAARLDDHEPRGAVDAADVAEGQDDQAVLDEVEVGLPDLVA